MAALAPITLTAAVTLNKHTHAYTTLFLDAAAGFTATLPAPEKGLEFHFVVKTAPTSNGYIIATNGGDDIMKVGINELEVDSTEDGPSDDNADVLTFVHNVSLANDWVKMYCGGTYWYVTGQTRADGGITTGTT